MKFTRNAKFMLRYAITGRYYMDKSQETEEIRMAELMEKIDKLTVPPHVARALGLQEDWKDDISPEFVRTVAETALKNEKTLKELSKY